MSKKQRHQKDETRRQTKRNDPLTIAGEEFRKELLRIAADELEHVYSMAKGVMVDGTCCSSATDGVHLAGEAAERAGLKSAVLDKILDAVLKEIRSM